MNIIIATLGLEFSGDTLEKQSLGGSETAVICVARELVKQGHDVRVFCNCDNEGTFNGVTYYRIKDWSKQYQFLDCDIFIASRFYDLGRVKINSKLNILWNHDTLESVDGLMSSIWNFDYMYCLSNFHKDNFVSKVPELNDIIKLNSNGVDFSIVKKSPKNHKIMFTSRPERGLMDAFKIYEDYGDKDLEFLVCNYQTLDVKEVHEIEDMMMAKLQDLGNKGFNVKLGRFTKEQLYKEIAESKAVLYPTHFPEIFCISAIEAQANNTVFITTDDFAMRETVAYKGVALDQNFFGEFTKRLKQTLLDDSYREHLEARGFEHVQQYSWDMVAKKFINDADVYFKNRSKDIEGILNKLEYESDIVAARELARREMLPEKVEYFNHLLRFVDNPELTKKIYEDEETHEKIVIPDEELKYNTRFAWLADMVKKYQVGTLLDYACHMGLSSIITSNRNPGVKITGYDISEKAIDKAKLRIESHAENKQNLEFISNKDNLKQGFDALFCGEYLEHVLDPEGEVKRLEGYVKDGGKIFFTVPRGAWEWVSHEENVKKDVVYHVNSIDYQDIQDMFGHRKDFEVLSLVSGFGTNGEMCGQYLIQYTKDDRHVGKRNFDKKFLTTRPYQGISACIIAKDASKDIEQCLDSFYKDVDEVIIAYDPASKDKQDFMARVHKYYNVKVYDMPHAISNPDMWGFANARNFTISKASHKWIFWIDTDERLIKTEPIKKFLDTTLLNGFTIKQHHAQFDNFSEADKPTRLFRRGKGEFVGYIHEQPQAMDDINEPISPALIMDAANIVNFGMINEGMRRDKALGRNLELLKVDVTKNVEERKAKWLPIRKLSMILVMRDFFNRMQWGYEKYKTYKTRDVMEHCLPKMKWIFNEYFRKEDGLYREMAEQILQKAYEAANIGIPCAFKIAGKEVVKRVDIDDIDDFKELVNKRLTDARKIS